MINKTIGFIGAGKCGMSLAYYFKSNGIDISGFSVRCDTVAKNEMTSRMGFDFEFDIKPRRQLVHDSDIIFVSVNDGAVSSVWDSIKDFDLGGKIICHCSGCMASDIFVGADKNAVCSVHPMLAFNSRRTSLSAIQEAFFTIEGGEAAVHTISELLELCGNKYKIISADSKIKYHAAACFASNFVVAVCHEAVRLLTECGFSENDALSALSPMILANSQNIVSCGTKGAITGPAARGDTVTINKHLSVLDKQTSSLYKQLTETIYGICQQEENNNAEK